MTIYLYGMTLPIIVAILMICFDGESMEVDFEESIPNNVVIITWIVICHTILWPIALCVQYYYYESDIKRKFKEWNQQQHY